MSADTDHPVDVPELPSEDRLDRLASIVNPLRRVTQPKLYGAENVPSDGALLAGNHTIYGLLDTPFLIGELWRERRVWVRGLGDHAHYKLPVWRDFLELGGMVRGTRDNVRELMRQGESILVFPGGGREVTKRKDEKYKLIWKERVGFAKLAIEAGYPIVPFAAVGGEEMLDVVVGAENPVFARISGLIESVAGAELMPIVRGVGPTPLPRPERLYFWFGEPIATASFAGGGDEAAHDLQREVKAAVASGIDLLHAEREADPRRGLLPRLLER